MEVGDTVFSRSFKSETKKGWSREKANNGHIMVFVYFGTEPLNGSNPLNTDDFLKSRWTPYLELKEKLEKLEEEVKKH